MEREKNEQFGQISGERRTSSFDTNGRREQRNILAEELTERERNEKL